MATVLGSKFRGCLLGALFGDALGALFEMDYWERPFPLEKFDEFSSEKLLARQNSGELFKYTDDTAMTKAICRSLLSKKLFNINDMAMKFVEEFYSDRFRGYGGGVVKVFERLKTGDHDDDVTRPSREQFNGTGSYGNGAAMRVSPLPLFYHNDFENLIKDSRNSALITHSHILGVHGAVLQAVAIYEALHTVTGELDVAQYIDKLIDTAKTLETDSTKLYAKSAKVDSQEGEKERSSYVTQLHHIKAMLLDNEGSPEREQVVEMLGNGIKAVEAVPAAIFAFLHKSSSSLKDVVLYAISLGGDTDTIASMAGAIAGAYWGNDSIPKEWFGATESVEEVQAFADQLYQLRAEK